MRDPNLVETLIWTPNIEWKNEKKNYFQVVTKILILFIFRKINFEISYPLYLDPFTPTWTIYIYNFLLTSSSSLSQQLKKKNLCNFYFFRQCQLTGEESFSVTSPLNSAAAVVASGQNSPAFSTQNPVNPQNLRPKTKITQITPLAVHGIRRRRLSPLIPILQPTNLPISKPQKPFKDSDESAAKASPLKKTPTTRI